MSHPPLDPVLRSARREAALALLLWLAAAVYTIGYCYTYGYIDIHNPPPNESLALIWGIPSWVFWGILCPWGVCFLVSTWFAFVFIQDAPLEDDSQRDDPSDLAQRRGDADHA